jgi:xanthine dehydrogenase accessory factor
MRREILDRLLADAEHHREGVLVTDLGSGQQEVLRPGTDDSIDPEVLAAANKALTDDACRTIECDGRELFVQPLSSPLRMIIVGAVHIAQALASMATLAGWDVIVVDPRQAWAAADRFPGVRMSTDWPDAALSMLAPDRRTAVVTLTHDPKLDEPALEVALRSPAFYIGSLGSRKTHDARVQRLSQAGFHKETLARIHAPVGLAIGARTPGEIAVSILAQIVDVLRGEH